MQLYKVICIAGLIASCQQPKSEMPSSSETVKDTAVTAIDTVEAPKESEAKSWLINAIEGHFANDNPSMESMTTKRYFEYKTDATNVGYDTDGSLTEEAFVEKWSKTYDVKYAGLGVGFLISGQDWNQIKVTQCQLLSKSDKGIIYSAVLSDVGNNTNYKRDITLVSKDGVFLIDDVREYE